MHNPPFNHIVYHFSVEEWHAIFPVHALLLQLLDLTISIVTSEQ